MNLIQYGLAQIGRRGERRRSLAMLLDQDDLPFGIWTVKGTRSWRATGGSKGSPKRVHDSKGFSAMRSFGEADSSRWLVTEVRPFASTLEAELEVPRLRSRLRPNRRSKVSTTEERIIGDQFVPGVDELFVYEQVTIGKAGRGVVRYIVGNVGHVLLTVISSGYDDSLAWSEVTSIATSQAEKIRSVLGKMDN